MKIKYFFPVILIIIISFILNEFFPATNHSQINGKISGSVSTSLRQLVGEAPINISTNKKNMKLNENEENEILSNVDALLITLKPTHQINYLPLKEYLKITYQKYENDYKLYLPIGEGKDPENSIYLQGQDNGKDVFYQLSGGEIETLKLIDSDMVKK
ncbi:MAG: hypothetical protein K0R71_1352 [Bacillales bacterium]|jgi:hypothetical protein|nr:hypothetical protein [Bacillales bacterium]